MALSLLTAALTIDSLNHLIPVLMVSVSPREEDKMGYFSNLDLELRELAEVSAEEFYSEEAQVEEYKKELADDDEVDDIPF